MTISQYKLPLRQMKEYFQQAKKKRFSTFLFYSLPSLEKNIRFAISIKSLGTTAVERNRIKRVIRAHVFPHIHTLAHQDVVFAVHSLHERKILQDLQQCLLELQA